MNENLVKLAKEFIATREAYINGPKTRSGNMEVADPILVDKHYDAEDKFRQALKMTSHPDLVWIASLMSSEK